MKPLLSLLSVFLILFVGFSRAQTGSLEVLFDTLGRTCNDTQIRLCYNAINQGSVPACQPGVTPQISRCCITCIPDFDPPQVCQIDPARIPICAVGVRPSFDNTTNCPTCRFDNGLSQVCSVADFAACAQGFGSLPLCPPNTPPIRLPNCCLSCRFQQFCNRTDLVTCAQSLPTLSVCQNPGDAFFNRTTCCRSCRPPRPPAPPTGCNRTDIIRCLQNVPVCQPGEELTRDRNITRGCCPTCRRAETVCTLEQVVRCRAIQPTCGAGETPALVPGECCFSCRPPPPVCSPACVNGTICVRSLIPGSIGQPVCRPRIIVLKRINTVLGVVSAAVTRELVREVLRRFCDRNDQAVLCDRFAEIVEYLDINRDANGDFEILVPVSATGKRDLTADVTSFVTAALSDDYATAGTTFSNVVAGVTGSDNTANSSNLFLPSFVFGVVSMIITTFFI